LKAETVIVKTHKPLLLLKYAGADQRKCKDLLRVAKLGKARQMGPS
jgi:hypothetical protein